MTIQDFVSKTEIKKSKLSRGLKLIILSMYDEVEKWGKKKYYFRTMLFALSDIYRADSPELRRLFSKPPRSRPLQKTDAVKKTEAIRVKNFNREVLGTSPCDNCDDKIESVFDCKTPQDIVDYFCKQGDTEQDLAYKLRAYAVKNKIPVRNVKRFDKLSEVIFVAISTAAAGTLNQSDAATS